MDGAKRFHRFYIDGKPNQELWTGDDKKWVKCAKENETRTIEEDVDNPHFMCMRSFNDLGCMYEAMDKLRGHNEYTCIYIQ